MGATPIPATPNSHTDLKGSDMRSILVALTTALAVFVLGVIGAHAPYGGTDEVPAPVTLTTSDEGSHDTYGGPDGPVRLSDDVMVSAGVCRTFVGNVVVTQCVPLFTPTGGVLVDKIEEDGSARYSDGVTYDPDTSYFR